MAATRRNLLILGLVIGGVYGLRALPWQRLFGTRLAYEPLAGLAPFRRLSGVGGGQSLADAALMGIDPPDAGALARQALMADLRADPCAALFRGGVPAGTVPVAYFTDFRCPNCRVVERDLAALAGEGATQFALIRHEFPVFGPPSERMARAMIAAKAQGDTAELERRLSRLPVLADDAVISRLAAESGLDGQQLLTDMVAPWVEQELQRSAALAALFGLAGTPGLVIGRTAIPGAVPRDMLRQVLADEAALPPLTCLAA
jgi:predicted DsbA family dithiol-disulfide isomerase